MQLAHIIPTALLKKYASKQKMHLMISSIAQDDTDYLDFHIAAAKKGDFVILDNGAYENGAADDIDFLLELTKIINPQEVVLADVMHDKDATYEKSMLMLERLRTSGFQGNVMAVPQGKTAQQWSQSLEQFRTNPHISTIGIFLKAGDLYPRGGRIELLTILEQLRRHDTKEIHLLGSDSSFKELRAVPLLFPWVRSTDTAKFIVSGLADQYVGKESFEYPGRPEGFFGIDKISRAQHTLIQKNIAWGNILAAGDR